MWNSKLQIRRRAGQCVVNGWLSIPCGFSAEVMAHCGWDSLTIDMQHGLVDYQTATAMLTAISTTNVAPLVRVPWLEEGIIMKALDGGAHGVICPMVNTREDAMRLVAAARYPPLGRRSFGPIRALFGHADYHQQANDSVLVLAMIETQEALQNLEQILSVNGLDGVYIGPADLACALGCEISFTPSAPPVVAAIDAILAAAKKHGMFAGMHTGSAQYANAMMSKGFDMVTVLSDARLITTAATAVLKEMQHDDIASPTTQPHSDLKPEADG